LGDYSQPTGRLKPHAEAEAVEKISIVVARFETGAQGAFEPKTLFESELDPPRQLTV
jgi:hypothetical protein